MAPLWLQILIIFLLTLLNGFFAGSEIALISLRRTRIDSLRKRAPKRARLIKLLQKTPETFIATTQIGISIATIISSIFAGASLEGRIAPYFEASRLTFLSVHANSISFIIIVLLVAYVTIVLGELVPKSVALRHPARFALLVIYPIYALSRLSSWIIKLFTGTSNLILRPFHDSTSFSESKLSEEEIRTLIYEGREAGTIEKREHEMLQNVFEFSDMTVDKIMTPRSQIMACNTKDPVEISLKQILDSGYTRIPFYKNKLDNLVGILHTKDLLSHIAQPIDQLFIRNLLRPPFFVPTTKKISDLLQNFQKKKAHLAIVINEHGEVDGLVTLEDVLEEIVGEIGDESDEARTDILKQKDGAYIVYGSVSIVDFNRFFDVSIPEDQAYSTVSGFMLDQLERFPEAGDSVEHDNLKLTVKDSTPRAIKSILVERTVDKAQ
jgi:putative hemolysin